VLFFSICILFSIGVRGNGDQQGATIYDVFPHGNTADLPPNIRELEELDEPYDYKPRKIEDFACPTLDPPQDTNDVNNLKPGHIKVVMSLGDSITAGCSAKDTNILNLREYRGLSFPIGGDSGILTVPNLLKSYTRAGFPIGLSTGIGKREISTDGFNSAVSGAINKDMLGQAVWLVSALKTNKLVNITHDWKLLTIWIGSNNLCVFCNDARNNDANNYVNSIIEALDYLFANVPRVFVNIVSNLDITGLYTYKSGACLLHSYECACAGSTDAKKRALVANEVKAYQQAAHGIAGYYATKNSTQFAVVVQPFLVNTVIPDRSYLSQADCFHPSAKAHEAFSISLWNNMITRASQKRTKWDPSETVQCATPDTLLYTN